MQQNKLLTLKLEDRNRVKDSLDTIMDHIHDLIAERYLNRALCNNIDLVYGKMAETGYNVTLYSDHESEYIQVSV